MSEELSGAAKLRAIYKKAVRVNPLTQSFVGLIIVDSESNH